MDSATDGAAKSTTLLEWPSPKALRWLHLGLVLPTCTVSCLLRSRSAGQSRGQDYNWCRPAGATNQASPWYRESTAAWAKSLDRRSRSARYVDATAALQEVLGSWLLLRSVLRPMHAVTMHANSELLYMHLYCKYFVRANCSTLGVNSISLRPDPWRPSPARWLESSRTA